MLASNIFLHTTWHTCICIYNIGEHGYGIMINRDTDWMLLSWNSREITFINIDILLIISNLMSHSCDQNQNVYASSRQSNKNLKNVRQKFVYKLFYNRKMLTFIKRGFIYTINICKILQQRLTIVCQTLQLFQTLISGTV